MTDWGELYAHVIACTGWTWDYIADHVDIPRLEALNRYWQQLPPLHLMVAAYFGISPKPKQAQAQDFNELFRMFPPPAQVADPLTPTRSPTTPEAS